MRAKLEISKDKVGYLPSQKPKTADPTSYQPLVYNRGPIISPEFVSFYWGTFSQDEMNQMQAYLGGLAAHLCGADAPPGQESVVAQYGVVGASVGAICLETGAPATATEADVETKIVALQSAGRLPAFGPERLFLVFTRGISFKGYGATVNGWCAYHGSWGAGKYFAICPYPSVGGCGFSDPIPSWQSATSHEVLEAATDPVPGTGWTEGGEEGGDTCTWLDVSLPFGTVQRFADNRQAACSVWSSQQDPRLAATAWSGDRLDTFVRGTDGALWHKWWNGSQWGGFESLGGQFVGAPSVASWAADRLDVFVAGTDGALWHKWWNGSQWGGFESLGGVIHGAPVPVSWGPDRLDVFARGTDGAVWHKWWNGAEWSGFESLGGTIVGQPSAVSWGPNRLDVFARGTDGAMWHKWWDGSRWNGWVSHGGVILSDPNAVCWGPNRIDVFARGTDGAMYTKWWDGTSWGGWASLGGAIKGAPQPVSWEPNRIDVFAQGMDDAMWHRWWNGSQWGGWESLGGTIVGSPRPVSWSSNRLDIFAQGTDNSVFHNWWNGSQWGGWEGLGGVVG